ncbi:hypothetical protein [Streptomyces sp. NBC_01198]|uniref:hypothetical protein n=1 Tax=Streptomyces sp. NBC_01198 TaxID=2903769 RepID=UPI002E10DA69|nr:hypothetical protein OG702_34725 [Streptomyces sp. NBC_01198]
MAKTILISGASSGFGAMTACALADAGHVVHAGMTPRGERPFRITIDPADDGSEEVSTLADRIRADFYPRIRLTDPLTIRA